MAACVKYLGSDMPAGEIIFVRGVISLPVLALIAWKVESLDLLKTGNWGSHAMRSLMGTGAMFCWFTALTLIPLAEFTAITFTAPMFVTVLAMVFLGEHIHRYRWTALGIGFVGVLIMIGPYLSFSSGSTLGIGISLLAAVFAAFAMIILRSMSGHGREHAITITFYFSLTTMVCAALTVPLGWAAPTALQWMVMVLAGLFGVFGQLLMSYSYRYAEASTIAPLDYTTLLFAVAYGYFIFDELPGISTWVGAPLVMVSGLIIFWREYKVLSGSARRTPVSDLARPE